MRPPADTRYAVAYTFAEKEYAQCIARYSQVNDSSNSSDPCAEHRQRMEATHQTLQLYTDDPTAGWRFI
jgi:hypothetical protein